MVDSDPSNILDCKREAVASPRAMNEQHTSIMASSSARDLKTISMASSCVSVQSGSSKQFTVLAAWLRQVLGIHRLSACVGDPGGGSSGAMEAVEMHSQ